MTNQVSDYNTNIISPLMSSQKILFRGCGGGLTFSVLFIWLFDLSSILIFQLIVLLLYYDKTK